MYQCMWNVDKRLLKITCYTSKCLVSKAFVELFVNLVRHHIRTRSILNYNQTIPVSRPSVNVCVFFCVVNDRQSDIIKFIINLRSSCINVSFHCAVNVKSHKDKKKNIKRHLSFDNDKSEEIQGKKYALALSGTIFTLKNEWWNRENVNIITVVLQPSGRVIQYVNLEFEVSKRVKWNKFVDIKIDFQFWCHDFFFFIVILPAGFPFTMVWFFIVVFFPFASDRNIRHGHWLCFFFSLSRCHSIVVVVVVGLSGMIRKANNK